MTAHMAIRDLSKGFQGRSILSGLTMDFPKGSTTVVLGESGTGKSVLLKCLCGLYTPDAGQILWGGEPLHEGSWADLRGRITYIFQMGALFDSMSVHDNVAFPLLQQNPGSSEVSDRVHEVLSSVGLPDVSHKMPSQLSGGMRKRVALARGLITRPEVILYDEPTTGLDPVMTAQVGRLIDEFRDRHGVTGIVVTHDIKSAVQVADEMVMLFDGRVRAAGPAEEFLQSEDPVVQQFLEGRPEGPIDPLRARN